MQSRTELPNARDFSGVIVPGLMRVYGE